VDATLSAVTHALGSPAPVVGGHYRLLRRKGEALHPSRYDTIKLARIRKTIPARFWSALYQQNPVPDDGAYFTKEQFKRAPMPQKERCNVMMAWDFAISEKKQNDFTVGTVGLQDEDDLLNIPEVVRFKSGDAHFIVETILNTVERWFSKGMVVGFEDGQIYKAISASAAKAHARAPPVLLHRAAHPDHRQDGARPPAAGAHATRHGGLRREGRLVRRPCETRCCASPPACTTTASTPPPGWQAWPSPERPPAKRHGPKFVSWKDKLSGNGPRQREPHGRVTKEHLNADQFRQSPRSLEPLRVRA
jgi:hypothetical protein